MTLLKHCASLAYRALTGAVLLAVAACTGEAPDVWGDDTDGAAIADALRHPTTVDIEATAADGGSFVQATVTHRGSGASADAILPVVAGYLDLQLVNGHIVVRELLLDFIDVDIDAEIIPPRGLSLTGIRVRVDGPVATEAVDMGTHLAAIASFDVVAEWSVDLGDGVTHPLRPVVLRDLPFSLELHRDPLGDVRARLVALQDGPFWSWAGLFELSNLSMDLAGVVR